MSKLLHPIFAKTDDFEIDLAKLSTLLNLFYATILVIDYWNFLPLLKEFSNQESHWLWPVSWMSALSPDGQYFTLFGLFVGTMILHATTVILPNVSVAKVLGAIGFTLLVAAKYSFGKIDYHLFGFMVCSWVFAFVSANERNSGQDLRGRLYFRTAQAAVLGTYFLSGLWKLRVLLSEIGRNGLMFDPISIQIQRTAVQNFAEATATSPFAQMPVLGMTVWIGFGLIELSLISALFFPRLQKIAGIAVIAIHAFAATLMGIYFLPAALLAGILFCANPFVAKPSAEKFHT